MGETAGETQSVNGEQGQKGSEAPPPFASPRTHSEGPARPSGSWQPPQRSAQPPEQHLGSQGPVTGKKTTYP